jgi:hypothetical protein
MLRLRSRWGNRCARVGALALAVSVAPALPASAGEGLFRRSQNDTVVMPAVPVVPAQTYVADRPVVSRLLAPKQLTLSNYAGANYPSAAPGAAITPTEFRLRTGRPVRPRWFGPDQGW